MDVPYGYCDVLDDGRVVSAPWNTRGVVQFGDSRVTYVNLPTWLLFLRACLSPAGVAYAVGKGQDDGLAYLVCEDGRCAVLGPTVGNQCIVIGAGATDLFVAFQSGNTSITTMVFQADRMDPWITTAGLDIPLWSQGFRDIDTLSGLPISTNPIFEMLAGRQVGWACKRPIRTLAQDVETGYPVISDGRAIGVLEQDACYEPHLSANGKYWVCRSNSTVLHGEVPADLPPMVEQPLRLPTFGPFNHPVLVAPFKDTKGISGAPAEIVVNGGRQRVNRPCFAAEDSLKGPFYQRPDGIYTEATDPAEVVALAKQYRMRVLACHDAQIGVNIGQLSELRSCDLPMVELYRYEGDGSAESAHARWRQQIIWLLGYWHYDIGLIPQFYTMSKKDGSELWTEQEVLDGLQPLTDLVNLSPRIKLIAPFSYDRANGISGHAPFEEAFERLLAAANPNHATIEFRPIPSDPPVVLPAPVTPPPPVIPIPEPIPAPTDEDDIMELPKIGQRGAFRAVGETTVPANVVIVECGDKDFMSLEFETGDRPFAHFSPNTGRFDGLTKHENGAHGEERIKFVTPNIFVSHSGDMANGPMFPFEWYPR